MMTNTVITVLCYTVNFAAYGINISNLHKSFTSYFYSVFRLAGLWMPILGLKHF